MAGQKQWRMFRKRSGEQGVSTVDIAQRMTRNMVDWESRGSGDTDNAMRRLSRRHGLAYGFLRNLRYRPPTDLLISVWDRLLDAYEIECARQRRKFEAELTQTKAIKNAADTALVRAAVSMAGAPEKAD